MDTEPIIRTAADVARGRAALMQIDPRLRPAIDACPELPLRLRGGGFAALLKIIVGQQLSVASASAIWDRVAAAGFADQRTCAAATGEALGQAGLSRPKQRYALALAQSNVDYDALNHLPADEVRRLLSPLPGIGPWTVDIYLMLCLGRQDVFAPSDLALQEATRVLLNLTTRPDAKAMAAIADGWCPWRAVAARLLWAYYPIIKGREGIL